MNALIDIYRQTTYLTLWLPDGAIEAGVAPPSMPPTSSPASLGAVGAPPPTTEGATVDGATEGAREGANEGASDGAKQNKVHEFGIFNTGKRFVIVNNQIENSNIQQSEFTAANLLYN